VRAQRTPIVVKASGLAAGKGVVIVDRPTSHRHRAAMFAGQFGSAGDRW
jgi:phosphoribosylamine-glycine ligase